MGNTAEFEYLWEWRDVEDGYCFDAPEPGWQLHSWQLCDGTNSALLIWYRERS